MKALLLTVALAIPATVLAHAPAPAKADAGFHERLYQRYCDKLRESPEAYVQFVRRMKPVHGFTYTDFAPVQGGSPARADCRVSAERIAEVNSALQRPAR